MRWCCQRTLAVWLTTENESKALVRCGRVPCWWPQQIPQAYGGFLWGGCGPSSSSQGHPFSFLTCPLSVFSGLWYVHLLSWATNIYCFQLWKQKVQDQGASQFGVWWESACWFADDLLVLSSLGRVQVVVSSFLIKVSSFLIKDTNPTLGAPPLWPHLNLITFLRPHLQISTHWRLGLQYINCRGHKHSIHSTCHTARVHTHTHIYTGSNMSFSLEIAIAWDGL